MQRKSGVRRGLVTVAILLGLVGLIKGCPIVFPKGFPTGSPAVYQGIVSLPKDGWDYALFNSAEVLQQNERERSSGKQTFKVTCLEPSSAKLLSRIAAQAPQDAEGGRDLWVRVRAIPRVATGTCMRKFSPGRGDRITYGTYLEIEEVVSARPLGCTYLQFVVHHLRCPVGGGALIAPAGEHRGR